MKSGKLVAGFALMAVFFYAACSNGTNDNSPSDAQAQASADSIDNLVARGKYLAHHVSLCMDCHSTRDWTKFSGPMVEGTEGKGGELFGPDFDIPGNIYAPNITPDSATGIGSWTTDQFARLVSTGIRPNGDTLFPIMPYPHYNTLTKNDVDAVYAYIKTLKAVDNKVPERQLMIPVSLAYPPMRSTSLDGNPEPDPADPVQRGEYLVNAAVCMDCHTPMEKGQFVMPKYMAGGRTFRLADFVVTSSNITPDSATGIGKWSQEVFVEKFRNYRDPANISSNPGAQNSIMPWIMYSGMTDDDLRAIYAYLRSIPPVNNMVTKYPTQTAGL